MRTRNRLSIGAATALAVALALPALADERTPAQVVESFHSALIDAMKRADELGYQGRYDELAPVLEQSFDLGFMAEKSVGRHWKRLDSESQRRWLEVFERLTTANYAGRFNAFTGESFETLGEEPAAHETVVVQTRLVLPKDEDVQLNYRLRRTPEGWRIVDIYLNGTVSELALRRSEYSSVLKRDGFDTLVAQLDQKVANLSNEKVQ
ncbi:MAG: ABC transporter substrate-binding protein [Myxococcota bacterium]